MKPLSPAILLFFLISPSHGAVERIVESFNGDGEFESTNRTVAGLDNAGWTVLGDGVLDNGGYSFMNVGPFEASERDQLTRTVQGRGSFVSRVEIRDLDLGDFDDGSAVDATSTAVLSHGLGGTDRVRILLAEQDDDIIDPSSWTLSMLAGTTQIGDTVPRGEHLSLAIAFDAITSVATFSYDNEINAAIPALTYEVKYGKDFDASHAMGLAFGARSTGGKANGILDSWTLTPVGRIEGDYNGNDVLDANDIDLLSAEGRAGTNDSFFDLNNDSVVDEADRTIWIHDLKHTYFGDANLHGEFNSADLVNVFGSAEYEDELPLNSTWATGDWNGDGDFTSSDLVMAFQDGGYEVGPRVAVVPEPSCILLLALGLLAVGHCRQAIAR